MARMHRGETFGTWLSRKMVEAALTQVNLAAMLGTTQGMVSNWCNDKKLPIPRHCDGISKALGVDIDEVLIRAGHRPELATDTPPILREAMTVLRELPESDQIAILEYARWRYSVAKQIRTTQI